MTVSYSSTSPYFKTGIVNGYLGIWNPIDIAASSNDVTYTIVSKYQYRPDLLAYDVYGTSEYWWVFAARNKDAIQDPIYDLTIGLTIYLPKQSAIQAALGSSS